MDAFVAYEIVGTRSIDSAAMLDSHPVGEQCKLPGELCGVEGVRFDARRVHTRWVWTNHAPDR